MVKGMRFIRAVFCLIIVAGCSEKVREFDGLWPTESGTGPMVIFDPLAKPSSIVPFPNDMMTMPDKDTLTGKRVNVPVNADTNMENDIRRNMNALDGFGVFTPITVSFDAAISTSTVTESTVIIINLNPSSLHYGEKVKLSLGSGAFPQTIEHHHFFDPNDPKGESDNLIFSTEVKATSEKFEKFYDEESNTLLFRPLLPLDQQSLHAVILTKSIKGENGEPIRSPFKYVNHSFQTEDLKKALPILAEMGIEPEDIAFAWVFTTQSITALLETVQLGLQGKGVLSGLKSVYPPVVSHIYDVGPTCENEGNTHIIKAKAFEGLLKGILESPVGGMLAGEDIGMVQQIFNFKNVDYFVFGNFVSPSFIETPDYVMDLNPKTGKGTIKAGNVPFFAAVPTPTTENGFAQPPYPVLIFGHGYGGLADLDMLALSNIMGSFGIAVMSIDAVGFGPTDYLSPLANPAAASDLIADALGIELPPELICDALKGMIITPVATNMCIPINEDIKGCDFYKDLTSKGLFYVLTKVGRAEDVNGDGIPDSGKTFVSSNVFRTRDIFRQTVIDEMQLSSIIKNMGKYKRDYLKGVFIDEDGNPIIGGPDNPVFYAGQSMGGVMGSLLMAVDTNIVRGVLNVGGGGLGDLELRSTLRGALDTGFVQIFGPIVVGKPGATEGYVDVFINDEENTIGSLHASLGDTVVVENTTKGKIVKEKVRDDGSFGIHIAADEGDVLSVRVEGKAGAIYIPVTKFRKGMGLIRNTANFRRQIEMAQIGTEAGDPVNYAIHYNNYNEDGYPRQTLFKGQGPEKKLLIQVYARDTTVPIANGIMLGRAAGMISKKDHDKMINAGLPAMMVGTGLTAQAFTSYAQYYGTSTYNIPVSYKKDGLPGSSFEFHLTSAHEYFAIPAGTEDVGFYKEDYKGDYKWVGVGTFQEKGFDLLANPDPGGDDYCPEIGRITAATFSEGNGILDYITKGSTDVDEDYLSSSDWEQRGDGILEGDYTTLAQRQAALFFKYGYIEDCYHLLVPMPVCVESVNKGLRDFGSSYTCP